MPATTAYHVVLDGQGYIIDPTSYRHRPASRFAAKTRTGDPGFSDFINGSAWAQTGWEEGVYNASGDWDPQHPSRARDASAVDGSFADLRLGRQMTQVFATGIYQVAYFQGALWGIGEAGSTLYRSTTGTTWTSFLNLATVSACSSLRALAVVPGGLYGGPAAASLMIGAGDNGKVFAFDGTTAVLFYEVVGALAIRALGEGPAPDLATGRTVYAGASFAAGAQLGLWGPPATPAWVTSQRIAQPHIEALLDYADDLYFAGVDDTFGVGGALYTSRGRGADARRVVASGANAIASFFPYKGGLLAGSYPRGRVWGGGRRRTRNAPDASPRVPGPAGTVSQPIRAMTTLNDRLYVPITDVTGFC